VMPSMMPSDTSASISFRLPVSMNSFMAVPFRQPQGLR
jgi:hypothetical protein